MNRRRLLVSAAVTVGVTGCIDLPSSSDDEGSPGRNSTAVKRTPDSCPDDERLAVVVGNNTDESKHVAVSLSRAGELLLRKETTLGSDGTETDGYVVDDIGCLGDTYSFEIDVEGREPVEHSFTASYDGFLTANVNEDEVFVAFQAGD